MWLWHRFIHLFGWHRWYFVEWRENESFIWRVFRCRFCEETEAGPFNYRLKSDG